MKKKTLLTALLIGLLVGPVYAITDSGTSDDDAYALHQKYLRRIEESKLEFISLLLVSECYKGEYPVIFRFVFECRIMRTGWPRPGLRRPFLKTVGVLNMINRTLKRQT